MRSLSNSELVHLWERGQGLHTLDQGLLALSAALPESSWESLADMPIGQRNKTLLALRTQCFGEQMGGIAECEACGEELEFTLNSATLEASPAADREHRICIGGRTYRLPTSRDLAIAAHEADAGNAALRLLESCKVSGEEMADMLERQMDIIGEQMALADPAADILLTLSCARCGHRWDEPLDVTTFLWTELDARARRLLADVHELAFAYGWTERDILSLGEHRRAGYLQMVRA